MTPIKLTLVYISVEFDQRIFSDPKAVPPLIHKVAYAFEGIKILTDFELPLVARLSGHLVRMMKVPPKKEEVYFEGKLRNLFCYNPSIYLKYFCWGLLEQKVEWDQVIQIIIRPVADTDNIDKRFQTNADYLKETLA